MRDGAGYFISGVTLGLLVWALSNDYRHKRAIHQRLNRLNGRMNTFQQFMGTVNRERKQERSDPAWQTGT